MSKLNARRRARLPKSAFAHIDSQGRRRLPIHDKAHVRNALARFNQVVFDDDLARERARRRVLNAAKKYGIVPVGFITGQLRAEQKRATAGRPVIELPATVTDAAALPTGFVTLLMSDIESSTELLRLLGDRYRDVLDAVRNILRAAVSRAGGREVDARADELFAVFERAGSAVEAAAAMQRALGEARWPGDVKVRLRIGIHSGRPTLSDMGYIGLAVHTAARVCAAAHGGQILVSAHTREAVDDAPPAGVRFVSLGRHRLPGLVKAEGLFQLEADGLPASFPPPRVGPRARQKSQRAKDQAPGAAPVQITII